MISQTQRCTGPLVAILFGLLFRLPFGQCDDTSTVFRVDISQDNGRRDVLAPDCHHWRMNETQESSTEIRGLSFVLRCVDPDAKMLCDWWKKGFENRASLASDGIAIRAKEGSAAILEMRIRGLQTGKHSIVSFHNFLNDDQVGELSLNIDGQNIVEGFQPSRRVLHDDDSGSIWGEFDAVAGCDVMVTWKAKAELASTVILNGFALDVSDPHKQAKRPQPFDGDEHAEESPTLKWSSPNHTSIQRVYFGDDPIKVSSANPNAPEFLGTTTSFELPLENGSLKSVGVLDPHKTYYWRIDSIPIGKTEPEVFGRVWRFQVRRLAFPGAEGYGRFARGGMGGTLMEVTNLDDAGLGSLRAAVEAEGPRIVVFRVGGTIALKSKLVIHNPYITIAGQTAPGGGICVRGYTFGCFGTHDVVIRQVRIRVGDEAHLTMDGTGFASTDHSIMDHCSVSWSIDEGVSSRGASNITFQRCIVAEALNIADHKKYQPGKGHSFAASISGNIGSFHHNLLAHCAGRNWSLAGGLEKGGGFAGRLDIRNNVVYNWEHRTTDGGVKALNFVNNFYLPGPATRVFHLLKPDAGSEHDPQQYYVHGNHMEGKDFDDNNWNPASVVVAPELIPRIRLDKPFCDSYVTEQSAGDALENVMQDVGANLPMLDSFDRRILEDVRLRRVSTKGSRSGIPGIIDSQTDSGGWPELAPGVAVEDRDHDGMPDEWERRQGLNIEDPNDAKRIDENFYSKLEQYLNRSSVTTSLE